MIETKIYVTNSGLAALETKIRITLETKIYATNSGLVALETKIRITLETSDRNKDLCD